MGLVSLSARNSWFVIGGEDGTEQDKPWYGNKREGKTRVETIRLVYLPIPDRWVATRLGNPDKAVLRSANCINS